MPEDRLLWLPSVSILLSAGIFPHCEARRGSEAPLLLLLLLLQTQGRASTMGGGEEGEGSGRGEGGEGGRGQQRWGWGGLKKKKRGGVSEEAHRCIYAHRQTPPLPPFPVAYPGPRTSPPARIACLLFMLPVALSV